MYKALGNKGTEAIGMTVGIITALYGERCGGVTAEERRRSGAAAEGGREVGNSARYR